MRYFVTVAALGLIAAGLLDRSVAADNDKDWGTVKGQVVFVGAAPEPMKVKINKDAKHCKDQGDIYEENWVIDKDSKAVRGVFVSLAPNLEDLQQKKKLAVHPDLREIESGQGAVFVEMPHCKFEPRSIAVRQGQNLVFKNGSPVAHSVSWVAQPGRNESGQAVIEAGKSFKLEGLKTQPGPIPVRDPLHPWMKGWVRVFDHPYYAVTDDKGNFEIKKAPASKCRLILWHEEAGYYPTEEVTLNGNQVNLPGRTLTLKGGTVNDLGKVELKVEKKD